MCITCSIISSPCVSFAEEKISSDMVTKLEIFIKEQGYSAHVSIPDQDESSSSDELAYIVFDQSAIDEEHDTEDLHQKFRDYCEENQLDASLIWFMFSLNDVEAEEIIMESETIKQTLTEFIKEQSYNASVSTEDESVIVTFDQQEIDEKEYDAGAITQKFRDYCIENQLDDSLVEVRFLADAVEIIGDATGDGEVNILDVISLNKAVMGKEALTEAQLQLIDFNQNGKPDADEALTLLKYIVGLISEL